MKKLLGALPVLVLLLTLCPAWGVELPVQAEAALLMEKETGQVLYAKNEHEQLEPASPGTGQRHQGHDPAAGDGSYRPGDPGL